MCICVYVCDVRQDSVLVSISSYSLLYTTTMSPSELVSIGCVFSGSMCVHTHDICSQAETGEMCGATTVLWSSLHGINLVPVTSDRAPGITR